MRYPEGHKQVTRRRIVRVAGRLFRRLGYNGIGIDRIMAQARLTRGGFYGYFHSKSALFAEVMRCEHGFNAMMRRRRGGDRAALTAQALEAIEGYLAYENRQEIGRDCTMASLSIDVARAGRQARAAYGDKIAELEREFARGLDCAEDRDPRALRAIALCVGGIVIARAIADENHARAFLAACRDGAKRELEHDPAA